MYNLYLLINFVYFFTYFRVSYIFINNIYLTIHLCRDSHDDLIRRFQIPNNLLCYCSYKQNKKKLYIYIYIYIYISRYNMFVMPQRPHPKIIENLVIFLRKIYFLFFRREIDFPGKNFEKIF